MFHRRHSLGRGRLPYDNNARIAWYWNLRLIIWPHAFEELKAEVNAWEAVIAMSQKSHSKSNLREQGGYPRFTQANQIKQHLRNFGIQLKVSVRNVKISWISDKDSFAVYVMVTREDLIKLNSDTPATGDPFESTTYNYSLLSGFDEIKDLLNGSNARLAGVLMRHDE